VTGAACHILPAVRGPGLPPFALPGGQGLQPSVAPALDSAETRSDALTRGVMRISFAAESG
jgi:hypothetical protein